MDKKDNPREVFNDIEYEEINTLSCQELEVIGDFRKILRNIYKKKFTATPIDCTRSYIFTEYRAQDGQTEHIIFDRKTLRWLLY